jgi:hypothetical protein
VPLHLDPFFYILRTGAPWRELPAVYGLWSTVYSPFRRWCRCGVWDELALWFKEQAKGVLRYVDGSYIKLHQHGLQGAKLKREEQAIGLSRGGMTSKLLAVVDELGLPCDLMICAGDFHDLTVVRKMLHCFRDTHFAGDKGFGSQTFRQELLDHGASGSTIPLKGYQSLDEQPEPFERENDAKRHLIENFF